MKSSFLPTIALACALIAAFSVGYFLRDSQVPESSLSAPSNSQRMVLTNAPRRIEFVRPVRVDDDGEGSVGGRMREGISNPANGAVLGSVVPRRPLTENEASFSTAAVQPLLANPQIRTALLPTFYVPVRAGRPPNAGKDERKKNPEQPIEEPVLSYAVIGPAGDLEAFAPMKDLLVGKETNIVVQQAKTLRAGIEAESDVLILLLGSEPALRLPENLIAAFRKRKILGIGLAAAGVFGSAGLQINRTGITTISSPASSLAIQTRESSLIPATEEPVRIYVSHPPKNDRQFVPSVLFHQFDEQNAERWKNVEVLAHLSGDEAFVPLMREENAVLIGVNGMVATWHPEFRKLVREIALNLAEEQIAPTSGQ